ncbi:Metal ABC transporter permease OS=Streptomyces tendae OX=1932 GN=F3L20_25935 PE=3 SV=1 [Streptomyces tendae]
MLAALVVLVTVGLRRQLFAVSQDEEFARVTGLPVRALNLLTAVTAAVTVTVAMRVVGLLLVSALMVVPVGRRAAAHPQLRRHLRDRRRARRDRDARPR